jgi:Rieske Fe-S protein
MSDDCQGCRGPEDPHRRSVLRLLGLTVGAVAASGCAQEQAPPVLRMALSDLPEGQRVETHVGEEPVELLRQGESVRARSLWCTHMGCKVVREENPPGYRCPCHDGRFDADGQTISGPPKEPLRSMQVRIEGGTVIVGPQPI